MAMRLLNSDGSPAELSGNGLRCFAQAVALDRVRIAREVLGPDRHLMIDANQVWEVDAAIDWVRELSFARPWFIEEPTSPDDVEGHRKIRLGVLPVKVATGEMCQNRIVFKQLIMREAIDVVQIDACRLGGVNEVLAVMLMAAKYHLPVCPHAGGVGLCEYVQNISLFDYIAVSGSLENRVLEYVDHLHEHFLDPVVIRRGRYMPPQRPGYSIEMTAETLERYQYPNGPVWLDLAVDDGGCVQGSRPVYSPEEAHLEHEVLCCAIPNLPSRVARTASHMLSGLAAPGLLAAQRGAPLDQALLEGLLLGLLLIVMVWRRQALGRPGLVLGLFFAGYGLSRFLVEFFRQPDAHFVSPGNPLGLAWQISGYGLTMGQILSLPMIAIGLYFAIRAKPAKGSTI